MNSTLPLLAALALGLTLTGTGHTATPMTDAQIVAALDVEYQAAVEKNDWQTMDRILHPDFTLVVGSGKSFTRAELIESARHPQRTYEKQVEMPNSQTVRMFGADTAVVTALLWLKGRNAADGKEYDYKLWFSDTYVRTRDGWRYAFGQASLRL